MRRSPHDGGQKGEPALARCAATLEPSQISGHCARRPRSRASAVHHGFSARPSPNSQSFHAMDEAPKSHHWFWAARLAVEIANASIGETRPDANRPQVPASRWVERQTIAAKAPAGSSRKGGPGCSMPVEFVCVSAQRAAPQSQDFQKSLHADPGRILGWPPEMRGSIRARINRCNICQCLSANPAVPSRKLVIRIRRQLLATHRGWKERRSRISLGIRWTWTRTSTRKPRLKSRRRRLIS